MARKSEAAAETTAKTSANSRKPGRRAEKSELTRRRLFEAAIRVVGDIGYSGATIRKITSNARIAHGTFYNYFSSQQDIFDQLLPYLGSKLLSYLDERLNEESNFIERQDVLLVAFDDFVRETPAFYRVMAGAEVFAPKAYRVYVANMVDWFIRHFAAEAKNSDLGKLEQQKLEVVALMVLGANHYINMRYGDWMGDVTRLPSWAVETFQRFVRGGMATLTGTPPTSNSSSKTSEKPQNGNSRSVDENEPSATGFVKFTRHANRPSAGISHSAGSIQLDVRHEVISPGHVLMELGIDRRVLNSRGAVAGGTLSALIEVAAGTTLAFDPGQQLSGETIGLNCTIIRAATEGVLVADARMENAGRNIRFVTVRITLDTLGGPVVANGNATMRVIE